MEKTQKEIKRWLYFFMVALFLSGLTAIPVQSGINFLTKWTENINFIQPWMQKVNEGINTTASNYPFLFYGYDWLAFAHFMLAILFIGPIKNPVRNIWIIEFGIIACLLVIPFALVAGSLRGIPFWWRLIDCSFGVIGVIPLTICYKKIKQFSTSLTKTINHENSFSF
jgi:hypothetical protein